MGDQATDRSGGTRGSGHAVGFGAALWMWAIIYMAMSPALQAPPWIVLAVVAVGFLAAGLVVGRYAAGGWAAGVRVGAIAGVVNLLILGSLLGEDQASAATWGRAAVGAGVYLAAAMALASLGAGLARPRGSGGPVSWTAVMAAVTAVAALMLLIAGGIVTGLEAGLAVRGWLTANDYVLVLFPLQQMQSDRGIYAEHAHRLWGLLVGLCMIVLVVHLWLLERRRWVCWLATGLLLAVIVQGVMGGTRVTEKSMTLAVLHGVFAQVIFAGIALVAVVTSSAFAVRPAGDHRPLRKLPMSLTKLLLLQLVLGALYRHLESHAALGGHLLMAIAVVIVAIFTGGRASARRGDPPTRLAGLALLVLVILQLALGVGALLAVLAQKDAEATALQVTITTAHHTTGAMLLATAVALTALGRRQLPADSSST